MTDPSSKPAEAGVVLRDILEAVLEPVRAGGRQVSVEDVRVGVFYTAVKLSTGHAGMAYCATEELPLDHAKRHSYMPRAGRLHTLSVEELAGLAFSENLLESSAGLAAINALAELQYEAGWPGARVVEGADALDLLGVRPADTVTLVGAFPYFIRQLQGRVARLYVTERNLQAHAGYPLLPAERQAEALGESDVVVITAAALGNHTLDGILALCRRARGIAIAGPTTPLCPGPLFERGVTVVGGTHIADGDALLHAVSEGGTGGHVWAGGAVKVNLLRDGN
jgi:uncharacterized protein (DUF4213/DUF364 family)